MKHVIFIILMMLSLSVFAAGIQTAKAGKYTVELTTQPSTPIVGENKLIINLKDGDKPLTGAGVDVHIDMAAMPMPADVKAVPGKKDGEYEATVNLSMAGQWKIDVAVKQMADMSMDGDGTAQFSIDAGSANTPNTNTGNTPNTDAGNSANTSNTNNMWIIIIAAFVIVIVFIILKKRSSVKKG